MAVPAPSTPLIGRSHEMAAAERLVAVTRMVTLVGTAGCGKTRLALELAGVRAAAEFVDLAPLRDPDQLLPAVARAVGVLDSGSQPLAVTLERNLHDRDVLLVLDNLEHLLSAARDVAGLLAACPRLRVLATSRSPVQVPGEQLLPVHPLEVPDPLALPSPAALAAIPSVALFLARVRDGQPDFALTATNAAVVAEICIALEGLPLALELAAARVRSYGLDEVLAGTRTRFTLLHSPLRAVADRHRSLADALRWSIDLIDEPGRALFAQLSVFAGGWTADAARTVCGPDVMSPLAELVDHSLVVTDTTPTGVRYRMLESVREYAAAMLDPSGNGDETRRRHLAWCTEVAEQGMAAFLFSETAGTDRADPEFDNLQAALGHCRSVDEGLRLTVALAWFWDTRGHLATGRAHLERLLRSDGADPVLRGRALTALGRFAMNQDDHTTARRVLAESAALLRAAGDGAGVVWAGTILTICAMMAEDAELAERSAAEALAAAPGLPSFAQGQAWFATALARWVGGDHRGALEAIDESYAANPPEQIGVWARGRTFFYRGWFAYLHDDPAAGQLNREGALLLDSIGDRRAVVDCLDVLGCLAARADDPMGAVRLFAASARIRATTGVVRHRFIDRHVTPVEAAARAAVGPGPAARLGREGERMSVAELLAPRPAPSLTPREHEVAGLVAEGLTNRQIGRRLGISERTAERHVENLRAKLGLDSRAQVAAWVGVPTRSR